jgi:BNR repeat-containing family member
MPAALPAMNRTGFCLALVTTLGMALGCGAKTHADRDATPAPDAGQDVDAEADAAPPAPADGGGVRDGAGSPDGGADGVAGPMTPTIIETLDVTDVWSGHPVAFSLVTVGNQQLAAFYDDSRQMTVAQRTLGSATWTLVRLATMLGWDSHNYVTMAVDSGGFIHVSGNMHGVPLVYFRTTRPLDIQSFQRVTAMVGTNEQSCTYPQFFQSPTGALVFAYRDGASGNGNYIFNIYDTAAGTWSRLLNTPLLDGQGLVSAYPVGPILGPDGWYHLVWVWRDTPDAATNHDLSYAKSRDLVSWQTASGRALTLPITQATGDVVDPVPAGGGIINNNTKIGFDADNRPIVAYHKYDQAGNTQLFNARFENGQWVPHQTSSWNYRWMFGGQGTLVFVIQVEPVQLQPGGVLTQEWFHAQEGGWGAFRLDPTTLAATATIPPPLPYPPALDTPESLTPGMVVRWAFDTGAGPDPAVLYMLRWETLESNQDMPRAVIPPPTRLRLYGIRQPQ